MTQRQMDKGIKTMLRVRITPQGKKVKQRRGDQGNVQAREQAPAALLSVDDLAAVKKVSLSGNDDTSPEEDLQQAEYDRKEGDDSDIVSYSMEDDALV